MRTFVYISFGFFPSLSLAELLVATPANSDPTITAAPRVPIELLRKQNNDRFMGWVSVSGGIWLSRTCDLGGTYFQSGEYWRCCATTAAGCSNVPVACVSGSLVYNFASGSVTRGTYACSEVYTDADSYYTYCNTGFLYENTLDADPLTNIFCATSPANWSYYRMRPSDTSTVPSATTTPTTTPASPSPSPTTPTIIPSSTPTGQAEKSESKAWIAGVVVGPIAGLALLAGLLWFFLRRKKKSEDETQPPMQQNPYGTPAPSYPGGPTTEYYNQGTKQPNVAPYGVASHNSWVPQSPTTQGSQSPQPQSPYGPLQGQQQWQPIYGQPPIMAPPQSPPPQSPPPQSASPQGLPPQNVPPQNVPQYVVPGNQQGPFSAELSASPQPYQQQQVPGFGAPPPPHEQQYR